MGETDPKSIVRRGYDLLSLRYRGDNEFPQHYGPWIEHVLRGIPPRGRVLDLGCGCGVPVARELAKHGATVTGVDISEVQIARARQLVPAATFLRADLADVIFAAASFDAACSFYALIHLPASDQRAVIDRVGTWLEPGGLFLATVGHTAWTGEEPSWLGGDAPMWWSHRDEATYRRWILAAGLDILGRQFVPEGSSGHVLFIARRPKRHSTLPPR
jgi:2-polyprenyl-3-methyl-5-hydroxy-6-metoxy-1,4-benzoquinol methylase